MRSMEGVFSFEQYLKAWDKTNVEQQCLQIDLYDMLYPTRY